MFRRQWGVFAATLAVAASMAVAVPSTADAAVVTHGGGYTALTPARLANKVTIAAGGSYSVLVAGRGGVPASGVAAVAVNVTEVGARSHGFFTVYPAGATPAPTSTLNFAAGSTVPNLALVRLGAGGKITVKNGSAGSAQLIVDVEGYFRSGTASAGGTFHSMTPVRVANNLSIPAGGFRAVHVAGANGVASSAGAAALNLTVKSVSGSGYATVYPAGTLKPNASTINFVPGTVRANATQVKIGSGGDVDIYNSSAAPLTAYLDVSGYYTAGSGVVVGAFTPLVPNRVIQRTTIAALSSKPFPVVGRSGVPRVGVEAVVLNLTATHAASGGYATAYPGPAIPGASTLNFVAGQTVANEVIVPVNAQGQVTLFNGARGSVDLLADVTGYILKDSIMTWSGPTAVSSSGQTPYVSCVSSAFCMMAFDHSISQFDGTQWGPALVVDTNNSYGLGAISCASTSFCIAVDDAYGYSTSSVLTWNGSRWSAPRTVDTLGGGDGVSCPTATFCMMVDSNGNAVRFNGAAWSTPVNINGGEQLKDVSCTSSSFCAAVDDLGNALMYGGSSWSPREAVTASSWDDTQKVSCTSASYCVTVTHFGNESTFNGVNWSAKKSIFPDSGYNGLVGLSCATSSFCVTSGDGSFVIASDANTWRPEQQLDRINPSTITSVSCPSAHFCVAAETVKGTINVFYGRAS